MGLASPIRASPSSRTLPRGAIERWFASHPTSSLSFHLHATRIKSNQLADRVNTLGRSAYARPSYHVADVQAAAPDDAVAFLDLFHVAKVLRRSRDSTVPLCAVPRRLLGTVAGFCTTARHPEATWNCTHLPCDVITRRPAEPLVCREGGVDSACLAHGSLAMLATARGPHIAMEGRLNITDTFLPEVLGSTSMSSALQWTFDS